MLLIGAWAEGLEAEFFESRVESLIQSAIYIYIPSTLEILSQTKERALRKVLLGAVLMLAILLLAAFAIMELGLMPVCADGPHSNLEARIMPAVLHASISRHAPRETNPVLLNEDNLKAAVDTYKAMCARCHSTPEGKASIYGQSFYPPAPQLPKGMAQYTDSQLFWVIKHGIRNTGMPAWGSMLSDDEVWQLVSLLRNSQDLPPSVESEWRARKNRAA